AQMTPFCASDSATEKIVQQYSTLVLSLVIGPPDGPSLGLSLRVRSGLMICQLWPSLLVLKSRLPAVGSRFGSFGENRIGNFRCNRSLSPSPRPPILFPHTTFP